MNVFSRCWMAQSLSFLNSISTTVWPWLQGSETETSRMRSKASTSMQRERVCQCLLPAICLMWLGSLRYVSRFQSTKKYKSSCEIRQLLLERDTNGKSLRTVGLISWPNGNWPPPNEPICGFVGQKCLISQGWCFEQKELGKTYEHQRCHRHRCYLRRRYHWHINDDRMFSTSYFLCPVRNTKQNFLKGIP